MARQTAVAMAHIHKCGVVHRDLKLSNLLLDSSKTKMKICDFGIALRESDLRDGPVAGSGTPNYMAPEMFQPRGGGPSFKSDVYAFGMVLWELVVKEVRAWLNVCSCSCSCSCSCVLCCSRLFFFFCFCPLTG